MSSGFGIVSGSSSFDVDLQQEQWSLQILMHITKAIEKQKIIKRVENISAIISPAIFVISRKFQKIQNSLLRFFHIVSDFLAEYKLTFY